MPKISTPSHDDPPPGLLPVPVWTGGDRDEAATVLQSTPAPAPTAATLYVDNLELYSGDLTTDPNVDAPLPSVPGYELKTILGGGGMGVVYRAVDRALNRPVALKMIASKHASALTRQRFQTEAQTIARLRHPNFVQIYEVGACDGRPFLALELVEGGSLAQHIAANGPLPARDAAQLVARVAHAMNHAHHLGVIHRDLKPGNILLEGSSFEPQGSRDEGVSRPARSAYADPQFSFLVPKITDFGLAKVLDEDRSQTRSGAILGTPVYMAPEQAQAERWAVSPATDVYALGVILFECLTGRPPFDGENSWEVLSRVIAADAPPPSRFRPRLSRDLDTICLKCLQKEPTRRYDSAAALAEDLDRFAAGEAISARPEGSLRKLGRKLRRRPIAVSVAMFLTSIVALVAGFWQMRRAQAETALGEGRALMERGAFSEAAARFEYGQGRINRFPGCKGLYGDLLRGCIGAHLRELTQNLMFHYDPEHLDAGKQRQLADQCQRLWDERDQILANASDRDLNWETQVRADLRDVSLRGLEIRQHLAGGDQLAKRRAHEEAFVVLDQLNDFGVPSQVVALERLAHGGANGALRPDLKSVRSDTEFHLLGRALCKLDQPAVADECFVSGLLLNPKGLALHFDRAALAFRLGRYDVAIASYTACLAIEPEPAFFSRRGFAHLARALASEKKLGNGIAVGLLFPAWSMNEINLLRDRQLALRDFDEALRRDPKSAEAYFGRGQVHQQRGRWAEAAHDFRLAFANRYPKAKALFALAVVQLQTGPPEEGRATLQQLLTVQPGHREALALIDELDRRSGKKTP